MTRRDVPLLGIDFGTSYLRAAYLDSAGKLHVLMNPEHHEHSAIIPSAAWTSSKGENLMGWPDANLRVLPMILKRHSQFFKKANCNRLEQEWSSKVHTDPNPSSIQDLIRTLLKKVKEDLEVRLGIPVPAALFSVPILWDEEGRRQMKEIIQEVGFRTCHLISENEAALKAYTHLRGKKGMAALIDFGGGFFSVTLAQIGKDSLKILSSETMLMGGEDLDRRIALRVAEETSEEWGWDVTKDFSWMSRLLNESKKMKTALTHRGSVDLLFEDSTTQKKFHRAISRFELLEWTRDLLDSILEPCHKTLSKANLKAEDIKEVLLAGGGSRIPYVQETIAKIFNQKPKSDLNVDQVVVLGNAIIAWQNR